MRPLLPALIVPTLLLGGVLAAVSQPPPAPALPPAAPQLPSVQPVSPVLPAPVPVNPVPINPVPVNPAPAVPQPAPSVPPPSGLRGLWVDGFGPGLRTPAEVRQMVTDAAGLGINALFVQAVRRGDCLCLLSSVPPAADIQKGFDPLAETIRLAHARRIRVIGWVSVTGAWNSTLPSAGPCWANT